MTSRTRIWGAVLVDGVPRCEIREAETSPGVFDADASWRPWRWEVLDAHFEGCGDLACGPARACDGCHAVAERWWGEWARRDAQRFWAATWLLCEEGRFVEPPRNGAYRRGVVCTSFGFDGGHEHAARAEAVACAIRHGFPRVGLFNGFRCLFVEPVGMGSAIEAGLFGGARS